MMNHSSSQYIVLPRLILCILALSTMGATKKKSLEKKTPQTVNDLNKSIVDEDFKTILKKYLFVDDFTVKPPVRRQYKQLLWKYRYILPKVIFPVFDKFEDESIELPITVGSGTPYYHINRGRLLLKAGDVQKARQVMLSGRARFGTEWKYHRRQDYFIAITFIREALQIMKKEKVGYDDNNVRGLMANAGLFLSWAYLVKEDKGDDETLKFAAPKMYYNMAAIGYNYKRFSTAFQSARDGINLLRRSGRAQYYNEMQRILAESFIQNRSYLEAAQIFDSVLRRNPSKQTAADVFARMGDIYYNQNNYELAADNYGLAYKILRDVDKMNPHHVILRGESLFWLGKADEAAKMLNYATQFSASNQSLASLEPQFESMAYLRLADALLVKGDIKNAKLQYFKTSRQFRKRVAGRVAAVRHACLELPNRGVVANDMNLVHMRALLEESQAKDIPEQARELAFACHVLSYTQRERTPAMVDRVREFYQRYPHAKVFLMQMIDPVIEVQAKQLSTYLEAGDPYSATEFFESTRNTLFRDPPIALKRDLFVAYMDTYNPMDAKEFYPAYMKLEPESALKNMRLAAFYSEVGDKGSTFEAKNESLGLSLYGSDFKLPLNEMTQRYLRRIKSASGGVHHLPWIYLLISKWAKEDEKLVCSSMIPALARIFREGTPTLSHEVAGQWVLDFVAGHLPDLFRKDESCSISVLELEFEVLSQRPEQIATLYIGRENWPMNEELTGIFWGAAEKLQMSGRKAAATNLYRIIVEKGPPASAKVRFARLRLDRTETQYEQMWK